MDLLLIVRLFVSVLLLVYRYFIVTRYSLCYTLFREFLALCVSPPLLALALLCEKCFVLALLFVSPRGRGHETVVNFPAVVPVQEGRKTAEAELEGVTDSHE